LKFLLILSFFSDQYKLKNKNKNKTGYRVIFIIKILLI